MENHVVCIPLPAQGHVKPMLQLAQILHSKYGFHITFINTHHIQNALFQSVSEFESISTNSKSTFIFESIPEGVDDLNDILSHFSFILSRRMEPSFRGLLSRLCDPTQSPRPPVTCIVTDTGMTCFTLAVADEMGIPAVVLETTSACASLAYSHMCRLLHNGIIPLPDMNSLTNGYMEMEIDWIESLKGIRLKDMPTCIRTIDPNDMILNGIMSNARRALESKAILINTFDSLEKDVLRELKTLSPNIYPIGPLHLLASHLVGSDSETNMTSKLTTSCQIEDECTMKWLDSQEPSSVLYVCFGTIAVITHEQLVEFAWGLINSKHKFLWVVRFGLVRGKSDSTSIPVEFEKEIEGKGLLVSWCDQERILGHPSIGGFLTHCGWNSTIESASNGVPMICWPFGADQVTNSWYVCNCLGIGMKMNEKVNRDEVEEVVKELMEGMKGKEMKKKAMELRRLAIEETINKHGSSYHNLDNIVNNMLSLCRFKKTT